MTPAERDAALVAAGVTTADIAKRAGVTWQHAHYVRRGDRRSPNVERAMSALLAESGAPARPAAA